MATSTIRNRMKWAWRATISMAANRSTRTDAGLNYQSGGRVGSRPTFKAVGVRTQTAAGRNVTIAVGRSSRRNHGRGPAITMDGGARCDPAAAGRGFQAKSGPPRGFHGVRAATNPVWDGRRFLRKPVANLGLESAHGSIRPATSDRNVTPSLTFEISVPILTGGAAVFTIVGATQRSLSTRSIARTSAIPGEEPGAEVRITIGVIRRSENRAAKNAVRSM